MARFRAVEINQPTGLSGSPSRGQRAAAIANASCAASSASSTSPRIPTSVASTRPQCSRKTTSSATEQPFANGSYLDRADGLGLLQFLRDGERCVEVVGLDHDDPAQKLLALDERSVGQ